MGKNRRITTPLLFLLPLLLLAMLGAAYSHWDDTVEVNGAVLSGCVEWDLAPYSPSIIDVNYWSDVSAQVEDWGDGPMATGVIRFEMYDLYPGAHGVLRLFVNNEGTIPLRVSFRIWIEPAALASPLFDWLYLNPYYDPTKYGDVNNIDGGWGDPETRTVRQWHDYFAINPPRDLCTMNFDLTGNYILDQPSWTLPDLTQMTRDYDCVLEPGTTLVIHIWFGLPQTPNPPEDIMGLTTGYPAFYIQYVAVQAWP